jgi:hypothetical protein
MNFVVAGFQNLRCRTAPVLENTVIDRATPQWPFFEIIGSWPWKVESPLEPDQAIKMAKLPLPIAMETTIDMLHSCSRPNGTVSSLEEIATAVSLQNAQQRGLLVLGRDRDGCGDC